jgi:hypothetical protein
MAIGDKRVIVWPLNLEGDFVFGSTSGGGTNSTQSLSSPSEGFVVHEVGAPVPSGTTNLVVEIRLMLQSAYNAIYGSGGNFTLALDDDGHVTILNNAASPLWIIPTDGASTADASAIGVDPTTQTAFPSGVTVTTLYQWGGLWYSDRPHVDDTGDRARHVLVQAPPTLTGVRSVVCHSDLENPAYYRTIEWDDLHHARMFQSAAADATAAAIAGIEQGDPNVPFESLVRYWADNTQLLPQRVFVRASYAGVAANTLEGPYQLSLPEAAASDGGIARAWQRNDLSQRRFRAALEFTREGS